MRRGSKGRIRSAISLLTRVIASSNVSICTRCSTREEAMMRLESTGQSLLKGLSFGAHLAQGQFGQHSGINFVLEQGREHCPSRLAHHIAGDYGQLDIGVF